jgi:hypothetical protein
VNKVFIGPSIIEVEVANVKPARQSGKARMVSRAAIRTCPRGTILA